MCFIFLWGEALKTLLQIPNIILGLKHYLLYHFIITHYLIVKIGVHVGLIFYFITLLKKLTIILRSTTNIIKFKQYLSLESKILHLGQNPRFNMLFLTLRFNDS